MAESTKKFLGRAWPFGKKASRAATRVAGPIAAGAEVARGGYAVYQIERQVRAGKLSRAEANRRHLRAGAKAGGGAVGAWAGAKAGAAGGAFVGSFFGPVGTAVGGAAGAVGGAIAGAWAGEKAAEKAADALTDQTPERS
jgi:phage tail tape-measure protein